MLRFQCGRDGLYPLTAVCGNEVERSERYAKQRNKKINLCKWLREAIGGRVRDFINSVGFSPYTMEREVCGEKYKFYIGTPTGKSWYGSAVDASYEMNFVKQKLVKPGTVVVECGAHHGAQTILLSRWVGPQGRVVAIEPMPENLDILKRNVEINSLHNVTVIGMAVGSPRDGKLSMSASSNASVRPRSRNTIPVQSITLDQLAEDLKCKPQLLKIDVEGYEYDILEGSRSILTHVPSVFIEVHTPTLQRYGRNFKDLWSFIDPERYDIFVQDEDWKTPEPYSLANIPNGRVHLFFLPARRSR